MMVSFKMSPWLALFSCMLLLFRVDAQEGYSSASMSMSQAKSGQWILPKPDEVIQEEYFNYHIHKLPRPSAQHTSMHPASPHAAAATVRTLLTA